MKRSIIVLLAVIFTFTASFGINLLLEKSKIVQSGNIMQKFNIVLDAGHGGIDSGTVAADGTAEKDINLSIVLILNDFLTFCGFSCYTVRDTDTLYYPAGSDTARSDLYNRLDFVNSIAGSLLISVHQNHFEDEAEWGMQVWYSPNDDSSEVLADCILNITKLLLQNENKRENKMSDSSYYLLYKASVPSVMVECGFMSNSEENEKLKSPEYQKQLAFSISMGVIEYLNYKTN
ncbi:MAG: N-acetylmuramoyl-L-alanine amidase [Clostridiales bacterium]|nr:N-acetylmuramoyl-L-alanine amidase [Clostridiales bacterium]